MNRDNGLGLSVQRAILASGLAFLGVQHAGAATIIHNNGFTANNQALPGHPNYGSNVSASGANWDATVGVDGILGTPDIVLSWIGQHGNSDTGFDTYTGWDGRGNVIQLDGEIPGSGGQGSFEWQIVFTPSGGQGVRLDTFDLDGWAGGQPFDMDWTVTGSSSGLLAGGNWSRGSGGRDTISVGVNGALGESLTLHIVRNQGTPSYLAMDNLAFDQLIPEPTSAALVLGGLGAVAMRRRRF